jgi:taurine dioxygenase
VLACAAMGYRHIEVRPLAGALGAELDGVDLARPLGDEVFGEIHQAFLDHAVIAFRGQRLSPAQQLAFAARFGAPEVHPIVNGSAEHPELVRVWKPAGESASFGTGWHTDNSFFERPSLGSVLYGVVIPPFGGDTIWASTEKAYEALSDELKGLLAGLRGVHSASRAYDPAVVGEHKYRGDAPITYRWSDSIRDEVEHPVIRTHPETGRKSIYVNPMFTLRLVGLPRAESDALLRLLYEHCARPDWTCRFRWSAGALAVWDNRCTWHYALDDYREFERVMHRVTIAGDRPV